MKSGRLGGGRVRRSEKERVSEERVGKRRTVRYSEGGRVERRGLVPWPDLWRGILVEVVRTGVDKVLFTCQLVVVVDYG